MEIIDYTDILTFSSSLCIDTVTPKLLDILLSLKKNSAVFIVASLLSYKLWSLVRLSEQKPATGQRSDFKDLQEQETAQHWGRSWLLIGKQSCKLCQSDSHFCKHSLFFTPLKEPNRKKNNQNPKQGSFKWFSHQPKLLRTWKKLPGAWQHDACRSARQLLRPEGCTEDHPPNRWATTPIPSLRDQHGLACRQFSKDRIATESTTLCTVPGKHSHGKRKLSKKNRHRWRDWTSVFSASPQAPPPG